MRRVNTVGLVLIVLLAAGGRLDEARAAEQEPVGPDPVTNEEASREADPEAFNVPTTAVDGGLSPEFDGAADQLDEGRPLGIDEAVALAIQNNLDVEVQRYDPLIAEAQRDGAWGAYDPVIEADARYDVAKEPNTFSINTAELAVNRARGGGVGVSQLIPYVGATLGLRYEGEELSTNSSIQTLSPEYRSRFFIDATVPLARGLIWNGPWTEVKLRRIGYESSVESFRRNVMDVVQGTVDSYWSLVAARDQVRVARKSLETARALKEQTETEYEVGVVSKVEVVEAEAGVAEREFEMIQATNRYRNAQDQLIDSVLGPELGAMTTLQFLPTEDPESYDVRRIDVGTAVETAFRLRPELREFDRRIEQGEVEVRFAKNQALPQFDLGVRYGFVGVSGDVNDDFQPFDPMQPPPQDRGGFSDSTNDFFNDDGADNFRVTGTFSIPFPNTTARKRLTQRELELRRSQTQRVRQEQQIILEVRNAARDLRASAEGILAAERRRVAAAEQLRAERIRLEHGESTPFEVLQRESDLVEAESQKIGALRVYRSAEVGLERAQGTILDFYDVRLDQVRDASHPVRRASR